MNAPARPRVGLLATGVTAPTGTGIYGRRLAQWLPEVAPDLDFILFAQAAFLESIHWQDRDHARAVPCASGGSVRRIAAERLHLPGLLRRERLDLVHALSLAAPPSLPCPLAVTVHDLGMLVCPEHYSPVRRRYLAWAARDATRRARAVVADSHTAAAEIHHRLQVAAGRLHVIALGVDPVERPPRARAGHILLFGAGEPRKLADDLAEAYRRATQTMPLPELILVGRHLTTREHMTPHGRIRWLPFLSDEERQESLSTAGLVVSASRDEGYDLPPHEALARGIPVLLSDIAVHREVYGDDAHYAPAGDTAAWAARLTELFAAGMPPGPGQDRVERWRARTWQATAAATAALYRALLAGDLP